MKELPIYFYDTETEGFGGKSICATYCALDDEYVGVDTGYDCIKDSIDSIINANPTHEIIRIYIHNASFDVMRFKEQLKESIVSIQQNGTAFISGVVAYRNKMLVIRDSLALLPSSLKKLSESFCPELPKLDLDFEKESFDIDNEEHITYAKRDVETLRLIIMRFANMINTPVERLSITAASQSFKMLKAVYASEIGKYHALSRVQNMEFRKFYFGGRVYIKNGHCIDTILDTVSSDITSSYSQQMRAYRYPLAGRKPSEREGSIPVLAFKGRFLVTLKITNYRAELPILPVRVDNAPIYPHGTFETNITDQEYEILTNQQKGEYDCIEIVKCYYWREKDCDFIFKAYVEESYRMKVQGDEMNEKVSGSGEGLRTVGKIKLNAPYGKLAQQYLDEQENGLVGWGVGYEDVSPFGKTSSNDHSNDHRNVHLAAMITASGRCQLYRAMYYYGIENVIYTDTDSVKVLKTVFDSLPAYLEQGDGLGQWKPEGNYKNLRVIAPKVYIAEVHHKGRVKLVIKSKGTPPTGMKSIVCDGITMKPTHENFYKAMATHKNDLTIYYKAKPSKLKSFIASGKMASESYRTVTNPIMVKGMRYNPENRTYHILTI